MSPTTVQFRYVGEGTHLVLTEQGTFSTAMNIRAGGKRALASSWLPWWPSWLSGPGMTGKSSAAASNVLRDQIHPGGQVRFFHAEPELAILIRVDVAWRMLDDRFINEFGDDYAQMGVCPGELFLELGGLDDPRREDYRLTGNAPQLGCARPTWRATT